MSKWQATYQISVSLVHNVTVTGHMPNVSMFSPQCERWQATQQTSVSLVHNVTVTCYTTNISIFSPQCHGDRLHIVHNVTVTGDTTNWMSRNLGSDALPIEPPRHTVTPSPRHPVTPSHCHPVTPSPRHYNIRQPAHTQAPSKRWSYLQRDECSWCAAQQDWSKLWLPSRSKSQLPPR